jgi:hypothetical protein
MTDRAKFEQMLELLINEDKSKAEELFHELVVSKSREIYESLLDDDMQVSDEETNENFELGEVSDEQTDDLVSDLEVDDEEDMEDEEGEEGGMEAVTKDDLDTAKQDIIDALTAEFESMMGGNSEEGDEEEMPMDMGMDDEEMPAEDFVLEYVEKVAPAKMGDNGANAKSIMAKPNNMGGTTANIAKGGESSTGGTKGGLLNPATKDLASGNVNVPGSKTASKLSAVKQASGGDGGANNKSTLGA